MTLDAPSSTPGLHLLTIQSSVSGHREGFLDRARGLLDLRGVHEIHWSAGHFAANRWRFYRQQRGRFDRDRSSVTCEAGPLLLLVAAERPVGDSTDRDSIRPGSEPLQLLDVWETIAASKTEGVRARASRSAFEAGRDLMLLLGTTPAAYLQGHARPWDGRIETIERDLSGASGWRSPAELFHVLNHTARYVILRNFEGLPESLHVGSHEDVDLLTDDYPEITAVMNARPHERCIPRWGGPHWVRIAGVDMWFDLRFVGDHYYDSGWAREVLDRRVWNGGGFYAPCPEDYFETLAYHAVVHKPVLSPDYRERLASMAATLGVPGWDSPALADPGHVKSLLDGILARRGSRFRRPRDVNVFYNYEATGHPWPQLRRKVAGAVRKAVRLAYRVRLRLDARQQLARDAAGTP